MDWMSKHAGQWQAQGDDIKNPPKGHRREWGQDDVPTKRQGSSWLEEVLEMCTGGQRQRRLGQAYREAARFVRRAPAAGYPSMSKHFYCRDDAYPNARIDLEIYGMAFRSDGADDVG